MLVSSVSRGRSRGRECVIEGSDGLVVYLAMIINVRVKVMVHDTHVVKVFARYPLAVNTSSMRCSGVNNSRGEDLTFAIQL